VHRPSEARKLELANANDESLYLRSATRSHAISVDELRSIFCCLITNLGYFVWQSQSGAPQVNRRLAACVFMICTGVVQYAWYWLAPGSFLKHRTAVRMFNRWATTVPHYNTGSKLQRPAQHCSIA
jgi:hypothetical protein